MDTYDRGEKCRQDILDKLRTHGPQGVTELAALTGASVATAHKRVHAMVALKELFSDGSPRPKYTAIVEKTQAASVFRANRQAAIRAYNEARRKRGIPSEHRSATRVNGPSPPTSAASICQRQKATAVGRRDRALRTDFR